LIPGGGTSFKPTVRICQRRIVRELAGHDDDFLHRIVTYFRKA
jgi:hypothetical protein